METSRMNQPPTTPAPTPVETMETEPEYVVARDGSGHVTRKEDLHEAITRLERERDEARAGLARAEQRIEDAVCDYRIAKSDLDAARAENKRLREALEELSTKGMADEAAPLDPYSKGCADCAAEVRAIAAKALKGGDDPARILADKVDRLRTELEKLPQ